MVMLFDEVDSIAAERVRNLQQRETAQFFWHFLDKNCFFILFQIYDVQI